MGLVGDEPYEQEVAAAGTALLEVSRGLWRDGGPCWRKVA